MEEGSIDEGLVVEWHACGSGTEGVLVLVPAQLSCSDILISKRSQIYILGSVKQRRGKNLLKDKNHSCFTDRL